ncbi:bacteriohemerythrin [Azoarcus sp. L1K30]|uniref:bacteriohemerythrin n=1 Tax=Azoarcus sp. L1K30 TaxID=2820277 RepID=UPI001B83A1BE|nr:bacteriohemerythrin [Azoarcus sp. L1K30]MBR0567427.1 bacteriohemerythrin [Azoarcus sp. L1K30]
MPITWTPDLDTGITVIDQQHMRIVDYINTLESANIGGIKDVVGRTLDELVDYTVSHFAFEESLQEEAGYQFCKPHRKVHELFIRRINEYVGRFRAGEDIASELHTLLSAWLINHIRRDDADYVAAVKANMVDLIAEKERKKDRGWLSRFFR